jgi:hypothetical protein
MLRRALLPCLLALVVLPVSAGARPHAHAAKTCNISGQERKLGTTYVTSLSAKHVSCGKAKTLVKAFHACRHQHGKAGHCPSVKGYSCTEKRITSPIQYDSTATCSKGSKQVTHKYTQNT